MRCTEGSPIWKMLVQEGQPVSVGEQVFILESMKMEIPIKTEVSNTVKKVFVAEDDFVNVEDALVEVEQRGILKWE